MNNSLKRHPSNENQTESFFNKRQKYLYAELGSPSLRPSTDPHFLPASHLPPSPPVLVDTPLPLPATSPASTSIHSTDSIPTMKRFTITTRHQKQQQQQQQQQEYTPSDYANINQILHEAHIHRHGDPLASRDSDMMDCDDHDSSYYDYANTILRHAFLQRHSSPPS